MPIFPDHINEQKTASGNYEYWTGIDQFRSYVKIGLSFFAFLRLQILMKWKEIVIQQVFECFMTSGGLYVGV